MIEKIVAPENLSNREPFGSVWLADLESGKQIWIQTAAEEEKPKWIRLGDLFEVYYRSNVGKSTIIGIPNPTTLSRIYNEFDESIRVVKKV